MQCDCACNGFEALHSVETSDFDVVLMDINMPCMNGFDAAHQIRLYEAAPHAGAVHKRLPIIGITAQADAEDQIESDIAGVAALDDCLVFPIAQVMPSDCSPSITRDLRVTTAIARWPFRLPDRALANSGRHRREGAEVGSHVAHAGRAAHQPGRLDHS